MHAITAAAAVLNQLPLDWGGNRARILAAITAARARGAGLLLLPEMAISGYGCEDAFHAPGVAEAAWASLRELAPACRGLVVAVGLPVAHRGLVYDAAALIVDGRIVGLACKQHLAGDGLHYEPRWFRPWPAGVVSQHEAEGGAVPIGDLVFAVGGVRLGFEICEDAWTADRPLAGLARRGVDVVLNPSASHFAFGKFAQRRRIVLDGSRAAGCAYLYANLLGNEAGRIVYDGGALLAQGGEMLAEGPRLSFAPFRVTAARIDLHRIAVARARTTSQSADPGDAGTVTVAHLWPAAGEPAPDPAPAWERAGDLKAEEFARAVALGLFDYVRKSRSQGCVVSLSGGCDSAAVATLVRWSVDLAVDELGPEDFAARLGHIQGLAGLPDNAARCRRLLATVYQGAGGSSSTTREAARAVAAAIGSEHHEWEVASLVAAYEELAAKAVGRPLSWQTDDLARQNVQARVRSPGVWMLANLRGALLLTTSNRSEAAVGYATMDGDTSGGLAPIAGIDKAYLRRWLVWAQERGPLGIGPIPALVAVTAQASSPELRPAGSGHRSEDDLMPFAVLDAVERAAIRDRLMPAEVVERLAGRFPQHARADLARWTTHFFQLWSRNQWKRERLAPAFHLDDENLDPKTWCRFPILSAGFAEELARLSG